jgi:hypothetical protein
MSEPLTYKLPLPPIVPRDHFSGEGEVVRFEVDGGKAEETEEGVPV